MVVTETGIPPTPDQVDIGIVAHAQTFWLAREASASA